MRRFVFFIPIVLILLTTIFYGCVTTQPKTSDTSPKDITRLSFGQLTTYVANHKGKPLLVNFWATWCEPCVEELPDLITLYQKHHLEGMDMVGFSVDFPEQTNKVVKPFVKEHHIPYPIYVADPDDQDTMINYFS